jgi:sorbitol/mannitol transport system permease protein
MNTKTPVWVGVLGWLVALVIFFPIFWTFLTSFKTEIEAVATPPSIIFEPTTQNYAAVQARANYLRFATNSVVISIGATVLGLALAIPAAYAMAFFPTPRTRFTLLWMLSTKMLPPVGVLVPIYLIFRDLGMIDSRAGLIIVYALMNLPIIVWMLFTFFREVPPSILEAGRIDGADVWGEIRHILCRSPSRASPPPRSCPSSSAGTRPSGASTSPPRGRPP